MTKVFKKSVFIFKYTVSKIKTGQNWKKMCNAYEKNIINIYNINNQS